MFFAEYIKSPVFEHNNPNTFQKENAPENTNKDYAHQYQYRFQVLLLMIFADLPLFYISFIKKCLSFYLCFTEFIFSAIAERILFTSASVSILVLGFDFISISSSIFMPPVPIYFKTI